MTGLLIRMLIVAAGLWLASAIVPGLEVHGTGTLLGAALLLGIVNAVIRPIVVLLTLPITVVTLGAFLLVVNAAMLALVASLFANFSISGFWAALFGSIVVSLTAGLCSQYVGPTGRFEVMVVRRSS